MVTTVELFDLFYEVGLLEHNDVVTTSILMDAMMKFEEIRNSDDFIECINVNKSNEPIAYISALPCYDDNIWMFQQHCAYQGYGYSVMMDVWKSVVENEKIKYVIGFYNKENKKAKDIWEMVYHFIGNSNVCDIGKYILTSDYIYKPLLFKSKLHMEAFKDSNHKIKKTMVLFSRPTGNIPTEGKEYDSILFKVCDETKKKFKELFI